MIQPALKNIYYTAILHTYCQNNSAILHCRCWEKYLLYKSKHANRVIRYFNELRGKRKCASLK